MRWLELLTLADDDWVAQLRVVDTALAVLNQVNDTRLHACAVSSVPTPRSLCELLDAFGISVSDDLAQDLGIVHLGVEAAWVAEQRAQTIPVAARLQPSMS